MRRLVVGDLHGCLDVFKKTLDIAKYSDNDIIYSVGDLCDRGVQNLDTLKFCMSLPNFCPVFGNHDIWLYDLIRGRLNDYQLSCWMHNGGYNTAEELGRVSKEELEDIGNFLKNIPILRKVDNKIISHNLFRKNLLTDFTLEFYRHYMTEVYDENYWGRQYEYPEDEYTYFVGHTPVKEIKHINNVYFIDTAAVFNNKLTIMDIDTLEVFQGLTMKE